MVDIAISKKSIEIPPAVMRRLLTTDLQHVTVRMWNQDPVVRSKCKYDCSPYHMRLCVLKDCNKRLIVRTPYKVGDVIAVLEDWRTFVSLDAELSQDVWRPGQARGAGIAYEAGGGMSLSKGEPRSASFGDRDDMAAFGRLRPAAEMPKWASRISMEVTGVRCHHLHNIHDEDAIAEGVEWSEKWQGYVIPGVEHDNTNFPVLSRPTVREMYAAYWDTDAYYGSGAWGLNPWVVGISIKVIHRSATASDVLVDCGEDAG